MCEKLYIDMSDKCNFSDKNNDMIQIILGINRFRHVKIEKSKALKIDTI